MLPCIRMSFRQTPLAARCSVASAAVLAACLLPVTPALARNYDLGAPNGLPSVSCNGTAANDRAAPKGLGRCSVLTMTTIYQTRDGSTNNPTTIPVDSVVYAVTLRLGRLADSKRCIKTKVVRVREKHGGRWVYVNKRVCATYDVFNEKTYFDTSFGFRGSRVRVAVLRTMPKRCLKSKIARVRVKQGSRWVYVNKRVCAVYDKASALKKAVSVSPVLYLDHWFGRTVTIPLASTISVKKGDILGLSVDSYAPILPLAATNPSDRWRASRPGSFKPTLAIDPDTKKAPDPCVPKFGVIFQQTSLMSPNRIGDFRCSYSGVPGVQFKLITATGLN